MKAVITSIGEPTTDLCAGLLEKYGFEVEIMDQKISWADKYRLFIETYKEDVVRIDADCLPLLPVARLHDWPSRAWIVQCEQVDFYSWGIKPGGPLLYRHCALDYIREHFDDIDWRRPEATAWRLTDVVGRTESVRLLASLHGFFQLPEDHERALAHRIERYQPYEQDIVTKVNDLCQNLYQSSPGTPSAEESVPSSPGIGILGE